MRHAGAQRSEAGPGRQAPARTVVFDIAGQLALRVLNVAVGLVVTIVLARSLGSARFGQWSTALAVIAIGGVVADLGLEQVVVQRIEAEPDRERAWLGALLTVKTWLGLAVGVASAGVIAVLASGSAMRLAGLLLALTFLTVGATALRVVFQRRVRNSFNAGVELANGLAWGAAIVVISVLHGGLVAYAAAYLAVTVLTAAVQGLAAVRIVPVSPRMAWADASALVRLGVPMAIATALIVAYGRIDQVLVFDINGARAAGLYGAAYRVFDRATLVPGTVLATLYPLMAAAHGRADLARLRRLVQAAIDALAVASLPALAFGIAAAEPAMRGLFGREFAGSGGALAVLMGAFALVCFGYPFGFLVVVLQQQRRMARYALLGLVVNVAANVILLPRYGFIAAAWITVATEVVVIGLNVRAVLPAIGMTLQLRRIMRVAVSAAGMGVVVVALRHAGAPLAVLLVGSVLSYPALLALVRAIDPSELRLLANRRGAE
jgi:O-antigen/teichoic acid export membrane protein